MAKQFRKRENLTVPFQGETFRESRAIYKVWSANFYLFRDLGGSQNFYDKSDSKNLYKWR